MGKLHDEMHGKCRHKVYMNKPCAECEREWLDEVQKFTNKAAELLGTTPDNMVICGMPSIRRFPDESA